MTVDANQKAATAARIYDYHLGGTHNFPADRAAGRVIAERFPDVPLMARANRAFLRRVVTFLVGTGIRQFLDVGSGIPTEGNVHEVAQEIVPDARVAYVDIDPVAESMEILDGNAYAVAVRGDLRHPDAILSHPGIRGLLDFGKPVALLLGAVLHFVPDDAEAAGAVARLRQPLVPGSFVVITHATEDETTQERDELDQASDVYRQRTATPFRLRSRAQVLAYFDGLELVEPGLVWIPRWRPEDGAPDDFAGDPARSAGFAGVGRV